MLEPSSSTDVERLREQIAEANNIVLFRKYGELEAAEFIGIHAQTLKQHRLGGRIQYLQIGKRNVAYFGFHIIDYLIGSMTWAKNPNPSSNSETIGSGKSPAEIPGTDTGGTQIESATAAHRLARQTLKKPKTS
jgi:hypothetical protein